VIAGHTAAVEDGRPWAVDYLISVDERWRTRAATIHNRTIAGQSTTRLDADGEGRWQVDGEWRPELDGCLDVDLEASACTNTFPVHRLDRAGRTEADTPAAFVRAVDLEVQRLEQRYARSADEQAQHVYDYRAPAFDAHLRLVFDGAGLVVDYPGLAARQQ
jgi:hypothetical protein